MTTTAPQLLPYLERLLDGETVEWKTLGEVCDYEQPTAYLVRNTNYSDQYPIPVLTAGKTFILGYTNETTGVYRASEHPTIIFDDFTTANKWVDFDFKAKSSAMKMLTSKDEKVCLLKYIYYWLNTLPADPIVGDHSRQWISNYAQKLFPLPPLRVQARIVEILDKFTQLETQLETELEARNKQYDFYRNRLLDFAHRDDFDGKVEWTTLGKVCLQLRTGLNPRNNFKLNTDDASNYYVTVRELGGTELIYSEKTDLINDHALQLINNRSKLKVNDILFSGTGTIGKTAFIAEEPSNWNIKEGVYALTLDTRYVLPMFVLRYLQSQRAIDWIERMAAGSTVRSITMRNLEQLPFPLPPLSEQRRIVEILDRFDTLTNSISEGLPREIALRRKQYEYYRDALLRFPPPAPTA